MEKVHAICALIRERGLSEGAAGAQVGVPHTTLSRWKAQYEEVELELEKARALYELPRLRQIAQTRRKDGSLDWRAQAWLVKYSSPERYGPPSRRRRLRDVEIPDEERTATVNDDLAETAQAAAATGVTFSPENPLEDSAFPLVEVDGANSVTLSPETPPDTGAGAMKSVTFSPKIPAGVSAHASGDVWISRAATVGEAQLRGQVRDQVQLGHEKIEQGQICHEERRAKKPSVLFPSSSSPAVSRVASHARPVHLVGRRPQVAAGEILHDLSRNAEAR